MLLQPFVDTQLQTQLMNLTSSCTETVFQSANRTMAGNAEAPGITLLDTLDLRDTG